MYNKWIFIKEKLNEVEVHQYESKLMVVHIYEDTPEPLFSPLNQTKYNIHCICTQTVHFKTKHKMKGFENCCHKM